MHAKPTTFVLRPVEKRDLDDLVDLAQFLDTVNFPNNRDEIEKGIDYSIRSFLGDLKDPKNGIYQFVVEDTTAKKVLGVSKILAHHGTAEAPHYYWQISYDRRQSSTLAIDMNHQVLKLEKDKSGHTEIAGIIVHPDYQGKQLGKFLFYVRFLFIALNRGRFLERLISELLPPFNRKGESELWEAYGRKFTGLTYQEADHLSQSNKEFIESLFPQHEIYTVLLPVKARELIGKVGEKSKPVMHLAEKNGFVYLKQIDPFDGGPHFGAKLSDVLAVKNTVTGALTYIDKKNKSAEPKPGLLCLKANQKQNFRAIFIEGSFSSEGRVIVHDPEVLTVLNAKDGDEVAFLPFT